jgi:hypothetical protein
VCWLRGRSEPSGLADWLSDKKNARQIPHRLEEVGYMSVRNPHAASDGLWKVKGKRVVIYAKHDLSGGDRIVAATNLVTGQ